MVQIDEEAEMLELKRRLLEATLPGMSTVEKLIVLRDVVTKFIDEQIKKEVQ